jgi:hypothetical protein
MGGRTKSPAPAPAPAAPKPPPAEKPMSQQAAEDKFARRRARRGGRALLSESRLNPEEGVSTLGSQGL